MVASLAPDRRAYMIDYGSRPKALLTVLALALTSPAPVAAQAFPSPYGPRDDVATAYVEMCASCHGTTLTGDRAQSLLDDQWSYGGDDASLAESIRNGRPGTAMLPFKAALDERQIQSLVVFIREQAGKAKEVGASVPSPVVDRVVESEKHAFKLETVVDGLDTPWGLEFLPDGRLIVTERPGNLRLLTPGKPAADLVSGLPKTWVKQDGGFMDVALHPDYAQNGWIYLGYSEAGEGVGSSNTVIVRGRVRDSQWVDEQVLFRAPKELYWDDNTHFGLRFLFDKEGRLYYSIGDRGREDDAQDLSLPHGKIHRVHDDGRVPADNPFVGRPGAVASIWSYGNRNPQGLGWHPVTGELWSTEHGPRGGDELNVIEPGRNYGWPVITYGINYDGTPVSDKTAQEGLEQPVLQWTPSIGSCGIAFYTGDRFPSWKNDLFVTALVGQSLRRLVIEGRRVVHEEVLFRNIGRIRDVVQGPDGYLYVALNNPGRIVRLVPATREAR